MGQPQTGLIEENRTFGFFLVLKVKDAEKEGRVVSKTCSQFPKMVQEFQNKDPKAEVTGSVSFGSEFWEVISPEKRPKLLHPFETIKADDRVAPGTGGDIFLHISSHRYDLNFELARHMMSGLGTSVEVLDEVHGFTYLDSRDLTRFIDGTANPKGDEERSEAALIGDEDKEFEGGSYVLTQRYIHDLTRWKRLSDKEQEKIIGRTKPDSVELDEKEKPPTAHISRVEIEEDEKELKIVRHSYPYGNAAGDSGLFFIAYARDLTFFEKMLKRMFGTTDDGLHDHLVDYTRAVSGAFFFTPSLEVLKNSLTLS